MQSLTTPGRAAVRRPTTPERAALQSGTPIVLGSQVNGNGTLDGGFQLSGYLSRVRVMDGVLRAEQILHNFNEEKGDFEAGPPQFRDSMGDQTALNDRIYRRRVVVFSEVQTNAALVGSTPPGSTLRVLSSDGGGGFEGGRCGSPESKKWASVKRARALQRTVCARTTGGCAV